MSIECAVLGEIQGFLPANNTFMDPFWLMIAFSIGIFVAFMGC